MSDEVLGFADEAGKDIARLQGAFMKVSGSPVGKIAAPVGAIYTDSAATPGAIRWIKTSGTGTAGWRANLAQIPATIQELATKYTEGGGDREELLKAVNEHE